jgi:hypothetical protein
MNPHTDKLLESLHHRIHAKPVSLRTMHLAETMGEDLVKSLPGIPPEAVGEVALHVAGHIAALVELFRSEDVHPTEAYGTAVLTLRIAAAELYTEHSPDFAARLAEADAAAATAAATAETTAP